MKNAESRLMSHARGNGTGKLMRLWLNKLKLQEKNGLISPGERQGEINKKAFKIFN